MMVEVITGVLALLAGVFSLAAAVGILRFPDALSRMHASSTVGTFVAALALAATAAYSGESSVVVKAVAIILFQFLTSPVAAHLLGRAAAVRAGMLDLH